MRWPGGRDPPANGEPQVVGSRRHTCREGRDLVPATTRALVAPLAGVGRDFPLSIEKLCPVMAFYVVADWREGADRCVELLRFGGTGHSSGIHCRDEAITREFAQRMPASRIVANTQTSMGATGYTTGLAPSMSLGCGAYAGNITSDNITPLHLLNVKRLAYVKSREAGARQEAPAPTARPTAPAPAAPASPLVDFVSEDDIRQALRHGRILRVARKAIITPAAREAASGKKVWLTKKEWIGGDFGVIIVRVRPWGA